MIASPRQSRALPRKVLKAFAERDWIDTAALAAALDIEPWTVRRLCASGMLPFRIINPTLKIPRFMFTRADVEEYWKRARGHNRGR